LACDIMSFYINTEIGKVGEGEDATQDQKMFAEKADGNQVIEGAVKRLMLVAGALGIPDDAEDCLLEMYKKH
jgi:hypothetical protein